MSQVHMFVMVVLVLIVVVVVDGVWVGGGRGLQRHSPRNWIPIQEQFLLMEMSFAGQDVTTRRAQSSGNGRVV